MVSLHNPASEPCVNDKQGRRTPGAPGQAISPADISMSIIALFRGHQPLRRQRAPTSATRRHRIGVCGHEAADRGEWPTGPSV